MKKAILPIDIELAAKVLATTGDVEVVQTLRRPLRIGSRKALSHSVPRNNSTGLRASFIMKHISQMLGGIVSVTEVVPMTPDEFRALMAARGWDALMLSQRWKISKRRVQQIVADIDRPRYYDDGVRALPEIVVR